MERKGYTYLNKNCPFSELFWPTFFPHFPVFSPNVEKCGKNVDQNNSEYGHFLRSDILYIIYSPYGQSAFRFFIFCLKDFRLSLF